MMYSVTSFLTSDTDRTWLSQNDGHTLTPTQKEGTNEVLTYRRVFNLTDDFSVCRHRQSRELIIDSYVGRGQSRERKKKKLSTNV